MLKKASKRLILSILALIASVALCLGVCLAWFATNKKVDSSGMQTQVDSSDIEQFEINAYYLNYADANNKDVFKKTGADGKGGNLSTFFEKVVENGTVDGILSASASDQMRPYDSLRPYATAILYEIKYRIKPESKENFRIYAKCPTKLKEGDKDVENVFTVNKVGTEGDDYESSISNCVFVSSVNLVDANDPEKGYTCGTTKTFIREDRTKEFKIVLDNNIQADASQASSSVVTLRVIMDYESGLFDLISGDMLTKGGSLNSKLSFVGDVTFGIEVYDPNDTTTPEVIAIEPMYSTSTTTQAAGAENMLHSWKFLLTYSDGTYETVAFNDTDFTVEGLDTTTLTDTGEAKVTYKGLTTTVKYEIVQGVALESITISGRNTVTVGGTVQLTATPYPSNATLGTITWSSSDESIATVDSTGKVTAGNKTGTVTITATTTVTQDGSSTDTQITARHTITVTPEPVAVTGVTLNKNEVTLSAGASETLTATVAPENATDKDVRWASDNTAVATVDSVGKVTAVSAGTANITATTANGGYSAACKVTVSGESTTFTVTWKNGDTVLETDSNVASGTTPTYNGATPTKTADAQYTYTFSGWSPAVGAITGDTTYTAQFSQTVNTYTVTFNMKGHGTEITAQTVEYNGTAGEPTTPTATGYTFGGWYTDEAYTEEFNFATKITANIDLYAKWTATEYTITYNLNEGTNASGNPSKYTIETATITLADPSKSGFTFNGWYDASDNKVTQIVNGTTGNITLTAKWTAVGSGVPDNTYVFADGDTNNTNGYFTITNGNYGKDTDTVTYNGVTVTNALKMESSTNIKFKLDSDKTVKLVTDDKEGKNIKIDGTAYPTTNGIVTQTLKAGEHTITKGDTMHLGFIIIGDGTVTPDPAPTVTGVTVTAENNVTTVANGDTLQMSATVNGENSPAQTVTWSIKTGATATGASVSADGVLSAGTVAGTVTVVATSTVDTSKSGELEITVQVATGGGSATTETFTVDTWTQTVANGNEIYKDTNSIVTITATSELSFKEASGTINAHVQSKGNPVQFVLKSGYTYTIKMFVGSSGSGTRKVTINGKELDSGAGTDFKELTWDNIEAGTYSVTQSGNIRLQKIIVIATPKT